MKRGRECWFDLQPDLDPEKLVFIDETGASTEMARLHGRAPRGERCRAPVPSLENHNFRGGVEAFGNDSTDDARRGDERCRVPGLCRSGSGPHPVAW